MFLFIFFLFSLENGAAVTAHGPDGCRGADAHI